MAREQLENMEQVIEALLFAYGEPLSIKKISEVVQKSPAAVNSSLAKLKESLENRGVKLTNHNDFWQLASVPEASKFIEKMVKSEIQEELTPAGLEIMAIVAYHGPIGKSQIESIRGVNSAYALRNLTLRGLIEKTIDENSKKAHKYQISLAALRKLGLEKTEDLPQYGQLKPELTKIEDILNKQIQ